ncbi:TPA: type VI secretion protein [Escherichia coli]|nr:type VI secretion protein [Escherichia coli]
MAKFSVPLHITAWVTFNETHEVLEFDMAPNGSQHYRVD